MCRALNTSPCTFHLKAAPCKVRSPKMSIEFLLLARFVRLSTCFLMPPIKFDNLMLKFRPRIIFVAQRPQLRSSISPAFADEHRQGHQPSAAAARSCCRGQPCRALPRSTLSGGGLHCTEVAFLLPNQQPRVWFSMFPKIHFSAGWGKWTEA